MTQEDAIKAHLAAHDAKQAKRKKRRTANDVRKKRRGLDAAISALRRPNTS